ncbi:MAG: isoprenylcysteine carboxylmethyltransferase family protein [Bryobacteraceae bacterium]
MSALAFAWILFVTVFVLGHLRVRGQRGGGPPKENRVRKDSRSNAGLLLQAAALTIALAFELPRRVEWAPAVWILAFGSVALAAWSLWALGRQWRIQAVITDDHELITTGPYRFVRHPVYLALLGMMAATSLWRGPLLPSLLSIAVYVAGTEVRVRAEDGILAQAFGEKFEAWRRRTPAYLPGIR